MLTLPAQYVSLAGLRPARELSHGRAFGRPSRRARRPAGAVSRRACSEPCPPLSRRWPAAGRPSCASCSADEIRDRPRRAVRPGPAAARCSAPRADGVEAMTFPAHGPAAPVDGRPARASPTCCPRLDGDERRDAWRSPTASAWRAAAVVRDQPDLVWPADGDDRRRAGGPGRSGRLPRPGPPGAARPAVAGGLAETPGRRPDRRAAAAAPGLRRRSRRRRASGCWRCCSPIWTTPS